MTRDAGYSWDSIVVNHPGVYGFNGMDMRLLNNKVQGVLFDYSTLFVTSDSGKTLAKANKPYTGFYIQDAVMPAEGFMVVAGGNSFKMNELYVSKDWGATWQLSHTDTITIVSLDMRGGNCYAGGGNGWVLSTRNGGATWTRTKVAANDITINKVKFGANGYPYLLGFKTDGSASYVYGSDNNGQTWHTSLVDTNVWLSDISMPTTGTGYIVANRKLYKTTAGGGLGLGVEDIGTGTDAITLYPNPATNRLCIDIAQGNELKRVEAYDVAGRLVKTQLKGKELDVSAWAKGSYFIRLTTTQGVYREKVFVK